MRKEVREVAERELLTAQEVCEMTGIRKVTLLQRAHRGKLAFVRRGSVLLFDREDFKPDN